MIVIAILTAIIAATGATATAPGEAKATAGDATYTAASLTTAEKRDAIWAAGRTYLGERYVEGGLDCSRLTQLAYRKGIGMDLPDDPARQMNRGEWVSDPRKGDLLFWSEDGSGVPTHVGIARGDGRWVLHASSFFDKVVISDGSYIKGYIGAKRLV